jgi:hypothetical protein
MIRELKDESYGVELLNSIGRAYQAKASQHQVSLSLMCKGREQKLTK